MIYGPWYDKAKSGFRFVCFAAHFCRLAREHAGELAGCLPQDSRRSCFDCPACPGDNDSTYSDSSPTDTDACATNCHAFAHRHSCAADGHTPAHAFTCSNFYAPASHRHPHPTDLHSRATYTHQPTPAHGDAHARAEPRRADSSLAHYRDQPRCRRAP